MHPTGSAGRSTCVSVIFPATRGEGCPDQKFLPPDRSSKQHVRSCRKNAKWSIGAQPERISQSRISRRVQDKQGLVCLLTERVDEALLQARHQIRIVANVAVGFDNIDVPACTKRGVAVTNTPGVLDETTADFAWTLMMAVARRLGEGEALARSGNWKGWDLDQLVGADVWGKTLGLVGFGRIGRAMARRASGFKMKVLYTDVQRAPEDVEKE